MGSIGPVYFQRHMLSKRSKWTHIPHWMQSEHPLLSLGHFIHCEFLLSRKKSRTHSLSQLSNWAWVIYQQAKVKHMSMSSAVLLSRSEGLHSFRGSCVRAFSTEHRPWGQCQMVTVTSLHQSGCPDVNGRCSWSIFPTSNFLAQQRFHEP